MKTVDPNPAPPRPLWRRLLRAPLVVLVALYVLLDDFVVAVVKPIEDWLGRLRLFERIGVFIRSLGPYQSLALFAVPAAAMKGPQLYALYLMGTGRFRTGLLLLAAAHLVSIICVERLFHVTRDKLMQIGWFAKAFGFVMRIRDWALGALKATAAWAAAVRALAAVRTMLRDLTAPLRPVLARLRDEIVALARRIVLWLRRAARP